MRITLTIAAAALLAGPLSADQALSPASFEVASVKPNASTDEVGRTVVSPGLYRATNVTARALVMFAFGADGRSLLQDQVIGAPGWAGAERYNVVARTGGEVRDLRSIAPMVRGLLEERFQMRAHRERRRMSVYALTMARPGGQAGPALRGSTLDCNDPVVRARTLNRPPMGTSWCGSQFGEGAMHVGGYTIASLTYSLSSTLKAIVINETGLDGRFDIDLEWSSDPAIPSDKPSLFTAVQEQLGLRLQSKDADVDVVVIDSIQRPSPD